MLPSFRDRDEGGAVADNPLGVRAGGEGGTTPALGGGGQRGGRRAARLRRHPHGHAGDAGADLARDREIPGTGPGCKPKETNSWPTRFSPPAKARCWRSRSIGREIGNAASDAMAIELAKLLLSAGESAEIVVLRGAGEDFCVGRETMGKRPPGAPPEALELRRRNDVVFNCYGAFRRCEVPVIGVVKGRAFGFGCAIAAVCDITLAADTATFQVPEMAHHIMPTMVMSALVDRVPRKALTYLVWSTAIVTPGAGARGRHRQRGVPGGGARRRGRGLVRADHEGAAAGAGRLQGLCAHRARHGRHRRGRLRPQHPCGDQFVERDVAGRPQVGGPR